MPLRSLALDNRLQLLWYLFTFESSSKLLRSHQSGNEVERCRWSTSTPTALEVTKTNSSSLSVSSYLVWWWYQKKITSCIEDKDFSRTFCKNRRESKFLEKNHAVTFSVDSLFLSVNFKCLFCKSQTGDKTASYYYHSSGWFGKSFVKAKNVTLPPTGKMYTFSMKM